jgi:hypothetical protein
VLVRSADIGGDDLEDHPMLDRFALWILELGIIDGLDFDLSGADINNAAIARHTFTPDENSGKDIARCLIEISGDSGARHTDVNAQGSKGNS